VQLPATQVLPGLHWLSAEQPERQEPLPLHQVPAHSPSGSRFTGTFRQLPASPVTSHAWQAPSQAVAQHTPSTQWPERHSASCWQTTPSCFSAAHSPATHSKPGVHPREAVQLRGQSAPPPHVYAPQRPAVPTGTARQRPCAPVCLQLSQGPAQAPSQHTPSAQKPEAHTAPDRQADPGGSEAWQVPDGLQVPPG